MFLVIVYNIVVLRNIISYYASCIYYIFLCVWQHTRSGIIKLMYTLL